MRKYCNYNFRTILKMGFNLKKIVVLGIFIKLFALFSFAQSINHYINFDGYKISEGGMINNNKIGMWTFYYKDGQIKKKVFYSIDTLNNESYLITMNDSFNQLLRLYKNVLSYEAKSLPIRLDEYNFDTIIGRIEIPVEEYYENGKLKSKLIGLKDSITTQLTYYSNGKIESTTNLVKSSFDGNRISFFINGVISEKIFYINNLRHGNCYFYKKNGKIQKIITYNYGTIVMKKKINKEKKVNCISSDVTLVPS